MGVSKPYKAKKLNTYGITQDMYKIRAEERVLIEEVDMNPEKMGKFILECRKEKHMTQLQLAEMINVTDKAVSRWERGVSHS